MLDENYKQEDNEEEEEKKLRWAEISSRTTNKNNKKKRKKEQDDFPEVVRRNECHFMIRFPDDDEEGCSTQTSLETNL